MLVQDGAPTAGVACEWRGRQPFGGSVAIQRYLLVAAVQVLYTTYLLNDIQYVPRLYDL